MDVFTTTGRHKAIFPVAYQEYSNEVAKLEENISQYLKVYLRLHLLYNVMEEIETSMTGLGRENITNCC